MASIHIRSASVEFPVYNADARSLQKRFIRHLAIGGRITQAGQQHIIVRALNNITLALEDGDHVGLIGHNGSGKSTLLRLLATIYEPNRGEIDIVGNVSPMLDLLPGIETELTGYENILLRGNLLNIPPKAIKEKMAEIAELSGLGDYLYMPLRTYSSGMTIRLIFAISASIKPDILLIDEIFNAGDAEFMEKARKKLLSLVSQSSIVVLASHSDDLIKEFCNKALLLENGSVHYFGPTAEAFRIYHAKQREKDNNSSNSR